MGIQDRLGRLSASGILAYGTDLAPLFTGPHHSTGETVWHQAGTARDHWYLRARRPGIHYVLAEGAVYLHGRQGVGKGCSLIVLEPELCRNCQGGSMSTRQWGIVLIALGVIVALLSIFADAIGVGAQPGIIGWKQILGAAAGAVFVVAGFYVLIRARSGRTDA